VLPSADVYRILERCVSAVHDWCTRRRLGLLALNPSKTETIWFGSSADLDRLADTDVTICLDQATIHPSDCVRDLGVPLDSSLSMRQHRPTTKVASTCFFHLRRLCRLRTPCSRPTEPKAVSVRVRFDAHRLLQRRSRQPAGQCTRRSIAASATRSSSVCGGPWATRSCHVYTRFVALVTNPSTNHLQIMYRDAFCVL